MMVTADALSPKLEVEDISICLLRQGLDLLRNLDETFLMLKPLVGLQIGEVVLTDDAPEHLL